MNSAIETKFLRKLNLILDRYSCLKLYNLKNMAETPNCLVLFRKIENYGKFEILDCIRIGNGETRL